MTLSALIEEAKGASPDRTVYRWRPLFDVFEILRGRGLTAKQAVKWLVDKKQIAAGDETRALEAFNKIVSRRNRRVKRS